MPPSSTMPASAIPVLTEREFQNISLLAYEHFGLDIRTGKQELVSARLGRVLRDLGLKSFQHYYDYVKADRSGVALAGMVDRLTTNHTGFFREPKHFAFLRDNIYPSLRSRAEIRIWSAACSTGEEPYSIALALLEESPYDAAARVKIKATDISTRVLEKAKQGIYETSRLKSVPPTLLRRYTENAGSTVPASLRFTREVRSMIEFQHLNLIHKLPEGYRCHVIFCRNVMIYFDKPTQQSLVQRLSQHLEPGGYLFIGCSETLSHIEHGLDYVSPTIYRNPVAAQIGHG